MIERTETGFYFVNTEKFVQLWHNNNKIASFYHHQTKKQKEFIDLINNPKRRVYAVSKGRNIYQIWFSRFEKPYYFTREEDGNLGFYLSQEIYRKKDVERFFNLF